jgi:hypothetical protein
VEFDDVGPANESETKRVNLQSAYNPHVAARLFADLIDALVQSASFGSPAIFSPGLFQMDQRPLSFAVDHVLQAGKSQQIIFAIHVRTPAG